MSVIYDTYQPEGILNRSDEAEQFLKQLANKTRLQILCSLVNKELSVSDLLTHINVTQPVLSQHLALLREAEMVATRREGQVIFYRLTDQRVSQTLSVIDQFFATNAQPD